MKFRVAFFIAVLCITVSVHAEDKFKQIRIFVPDRTVLSQIWSTGIDYEGVTGKIGGNMEFTAGEYELKQLSSKGISYQIVIDDLAAYYAGRLTPEPANALGFGYGSMGGYYTFAEMIQQLDSMRLLYPGLITVRDSIGTTRENRALWAVKISDNPSVNEAEPEVLYTGVHHAREPEGMMSILYYMWWLLQGYGTNAEATYLVNNRQMWFIPVQNPDGYVYNQTTNPGGGGLWRKNRRTNGDGTFGVDPNRNYGPTYMWNANNGGSSTSTSSDTYRGPTAFSEPENQAIDNFMRTHQIKTCLNYHTYGNYLIYPFGYLSAENSDSLVYRAWTYDMTFDNHFTNGTDQQTVAYSTRGNSDDYMFGDTTKPITWTMTPEVGTTGFWPTTPEILPLAVANLTQNKLISYYAGQYTKLSSSAIQDSSGDGFLNAGEGFALNTSLKNLGVSPANNLSITVSCNSSSIQFYTPTVLLNPLPAKRESLITFAGHVDQNAAGATPFQVYVQITDPQGFQKQDTVILVVGTPTVLLADNASGGTGNWTTGTGWGITTNAHTPPNAFTDSPSGNYPTNANNALTLNAQLNLTGYQYAQLKFWTKWAIEPTWDFATVELSTNNGSTWTTLRSKLSHSGSGRSGSLQPTGTWGYESYTPGLTWVEQEVDLTSYLNRQIKLRFRVAADGGEERDGFYVDDIRVYGYSVASIPSVPTLVSPANGATNQPLTVTLGWNPASGATSYRLQVSADSLFGSTILDDSTITGTSRLTGTLNNSTPYYWRVRAKNIAGTSGWSAQWTFTTTAAVTNQYGVTTGWNMISLPLTVSDRRATVQFPTATSGAFAFDHSLGYVQRDTLTNGEGYWLKFGSAGNVPITGIPLLRDTIDVIAGWNLIGSITNPVDTNAIVQIPPGILESSFYEYTGSYTAADTLTPAKAYWVKSTAAGRLVLSSPVLKPSQAIKRKSEPAKK